MGFGSTDSDGHRASLSVESWYTLPSCRILTTRRPSLQATGWISGVGFPAETLGKESSKESDSYADAPRTERCWWRPRNRDAGPRDDPGILPGSTAWPSLRQQRERRRQPSPRPVPPAGLGSPQALPGPAAWTRRGRPPRPGLARAQPHPGTDPPGRPAVPTRRPGTGGAEAPRIHPRRRGDEDCPEKRDAERCRGDCPAAAVGRPAAPPGPGPAAGEAPPACSAPAASGCYARPLAVCAVPPLGGPDGCQPPAPTLGPLPAPLPAATEGSWRGKDRLFFG